MPELRFCPQVAMGALLDPAVSRKDGKVYFRLRGMFAQKIVDFVAQNRRDGSVVAIIELDDRSHNDDKDAERDAMFSSAGYRIVRWNSKTKPDAATIRAALIPGPPPTAALRTAAAHRVVEVQRRLQAVSVALLQPVAMDDNAYVLRELQPVEDRIALARAGQTPRELNDVVRTTGQMVA